MLDALEAAVQVGRRSGRELMLVGAWARDIALQLHRNRANTRDVDFAMRADDWDEVHAFFAAASLRFDVHAADLTMRHRSSGVKVDVVPWGGVARLERLRIPNSDRELNLMGLAEAYALSQRTQIGTAEVAVPSPAGMLVLKLLAYADRLAPRDLTDAGELLRRFPVMADPWANPTTCDALASGEVTFDDLPPWSAGLKVREGFGARTCEEVRRAVALIRSRPAADRSRLMMRNPGRESLTTADRLLAVLVQALDGSSP